MASLHKRVLFFAPLPHTFRELCDSADAQPDIHTASVDGRTEWRHDGLTLELETVGTVEAVQRRLEVQYYHLIVIDCRHLPHSEADADRQEAALQELLDALGSERSRERSYPFERIAVFVGDNDEDRVDALIFAMGSRHAGACIRDLSLSPRLAGQDADAARARFLERFFAFCHRVLVERRSGKKAISCAGGGISGIYYELGVLKCLHDALEVDVRDFDMYLGISAGALVNGCLANGMHIDEMIADLGAENGRWPDKLRLGFRHLNVRELPARFITARRDVAAYLAGMLDGGSEISLSSIVETHDALMAPLFENRGLERFLRKLFSADGRSNTFEGLARELYIGATDQDSREHVLFGDEGWRDVPISKAIQASTAANPFFPSVEIAGRYYTDGTLTRTSNINAAIRKGADLIFVIDPFVPLISEEPGVNARHGSLWLVEQDIKTLAFTRFEQVSDEILRQHTRVNAYTFVPSNRMRVLMSQNPFAARNFDPIVCEAYCSTYRRLRQLEYKIRGELFSHGILFDLDRVQDMVERVEHVGTPNALTLIGAHAVAKRPRCSVPATR